MQATPHIIVIDDDPLIRTLVSTALQANGMQTTEATSGEQGLELLMEFGGVDAVLLDVMMPKLSGFEVCEKLKADPATRGIMILMVTALNELGDIERAVEAGTDDFLSKPVNKLELLKRVENMLKLHHVTDEVERLRQYIAQMEDATGPRR